MTRRTRPIAFAAALMLIAMSGSIAHGQVLDAHKVLTAQSFWDNRDWDWYAANIPMFECPDPEINTTYYYRWELLTKHLTYGSPQTGYVFTEFIDRPFWSGRYGAISCPAGHQLYEARWLKEPRIARDYARYWFETPGAEPRRYSCWITDAVWAVHQVHPDRQFVAALLPGLKKNYEAWERERFAPEVGLFWQSGHDDGMEININSRQTRDEVRGAPAYRPTLNSYLYADALAIARIAELTNDRETAAVYRAKARGLKENLETKLWDPKRQFFFPMSKNDEEKGGHVVKAGTLTYQTGQFAGNPHGRELIGYVPWQFGLPGRNHEAAWKFLMDPDYFFADYGPTVTERHDPLFLVTKRCCVWSGQSWPYATSQTLKALANLLQGEKPSTISPTDFARLFSVYTRTHRKMRRPYIAEGADPDTGSWEGYDTPGHSDHYFHSSYIDLLITGLVGICPRDDENVEINPLIPETWDYLTLDDVPCRGRRLTVVWDRTGRRYNLGKGFHILIDGQRVQSATHPQRLNLSLPERKVSVPGKPPANFAVNNDGQYFPRVATSYQNPQGLIAKLNDGNYWYHREPANRWTFEGSSARADWCAIEFGAERKVDTVKLYLLDDGKTVVPPFAIALEAWDGKVWVPVKSQTRIPARPSGHRANIIRFPTLSTTKLRLSFTHEPGGWTGLSEIEAWGPGTQSLEPVPMPSGNLAFNPGDRRFPKVSASFTSRFDRIETVNDGRAIFGPTPANRWTSYESPNAADWLQIDFGAEHTIGRVELAIYDDHGGVQAPSALDVEFWDGASWKPVSSAARTPLKPVGGQWNEIRFQPQKTSRIRVIFTHEGRARSGTSEVLVWPA